ncbi:MAG: RDD family protein [Acidobacteriota bacterium]
MNEGRCPSCGIVWDPEYGSNTTEEPEPPVDRPIAFEVLDAKPRPIESRTADWRKELRRRLDERSAKPEEAGGERKAAPGAAPEKSPEGLVSAREKTPQIGETETRLFEYQLKRPSTSRPLSNPVRAKEEKVDETRKPKPVSTQPKVRDEAASRSRGLAPALGSVPRPLQRRLKLESTTAVPAAGEDDPESGASAVGQPEDEAVRVPVSREILLSRFLAGIIDVTVPLALGMSLALVAAWRIGFDFFAYGSLRMAILFSLGFYFFNSVFFLLLSGQTPGMYAAQLTLADAERRDDVPVTSVLLRVILFLPSCLTVIGLFWSIFDPERRCLHDILSGSFVINAGPASAARRAARDV